MSSEARKVLSFADFCTTAGDLDFAEVEIRPDKVVRLATITAEDLAEWHEIKDDKTTRKYAGPLLISRSMVDESGKRTGFTTRFEAMTEEQKNQLLLLQKTLNLRVSETLLRKIMALNGLTVGGAPVAKND
jgi:hypothetical protein